MHLLLEENLGKAKTIRGEKWAIRFHPIWMRKMT
jgi:hypothetical protein